MRSRCIRFVTAIAPWMVLSCTALTELPEPADPPIVGEESCEGFQITCDGACVDVSRSLDHCGACDTPCEHDQATSTCDAGACQLAACDDGFLDCDVDPANGCETQSDTSAEHCGACDAPCPATPANGTAACAMGQCALTSCATGFADCDMDVRNGCEVELASDGDNCRACGHTCLGGTCEDATCLPVEIDSGQPNVEAIGAHGDQVFWTRYQVPNANAGLGSVRSATETAPGEFTFTTLLGDLCEPTQLIVGPSALYVSDRCTFLPTGSEGLHQVEFDGSDSFLMSGAAGCRGPIAFEDDRLFFWGQNGGETWLLAVSTTGAAPSPLLAVDSVSFDVLAVQDGFAFFFDESLFANSRVLTWAVDSGSSATTTLNQHAAMGAPRKLLVSGDQLFMLGFGELARLSPENPGPTTTVDDEARGVALAADDTHVYYSVMATGWHLRKMPIAGGMHEDIAALSESAGAIYADDAAVYWEDAGRIFRLAK